jgi:alpha-ketoglutarate-dependent taurine dioxygenase
MLQQKRSFKVPALGKKSQSPVEVSQNGLVEQTSLFDGEKFPLVFRPIVPGVDLLQWAEANRDLIERSTLSCGALLFRGFNVPSPEYFQNFAKIVGEAPVHYEANIYPRRDEDKGSVRAGTTYRPELKLRWHNEDSFDAFLWPKKIMFHSHVEALEGGETPICDLTEMFQRIEPEIRRKFMEKGVLYVRTYYPELGMHWEQEFETSSHEALKERCRRTQIEYEWVGNRLRTRRHRPAVIRHPQTGEMIWFNLLQVWHPASLEQGVLSSWKASFSMEEFPVNVYYGDGSTIEDEVMEHIFSVYDSLETAFLWQHGDIMLLDNLAVSHARNSFKGPRQLFVAMDKNVRLDEIPLESRSWTPEQALASV